jgi:hypothetical protein
LTNSKEVMARAVQEFEELLKMGTPKDSGKIDGEGDCVGGSKDG